MKDNGLNVSHNVHSLNAVGNDESHPSQLSNKPLYAAAYGPYPQSLQCFHHLQ